jgi:hypothetical protein
MAQARVLFLGTLPPPLGGVSVYCKRRISQALQAGVICELFDTKLKLSLIRLIVRSHLLALSNQQFEIEVNTSNPIAIRALHYFGLSRFCTFIDHNGSRRFKSKLETSLLRKFATDCRRVRIVNQDLFETYRRIGLNDFANFEVFSPYIPPTEGEVRDAREQYAFAYRGLVDEVSSRTIVLTSAWKVSHPDVYGLLDCIDIYSKLAPNFRHVKFVLMVGEYAKSEFADEVRLRVESLALKQPNVICINGGVPQWPLLPNVVVFLRLTTTDGDSVSVREALEQGCKVVATDVCTRPAGVYLTKSGDKDASIRLLTDLLSNN